MSKNTLLRALHGEQTDTLPWLPHIGTHAAQLLDVTAEEYLQDANLLASGAILCAERYECDGIPLLDDPQMEAISLGCTPHWSEQGPPSIVSSPYFKIAPDQFIAQLPPLPNETTGRWPTVIAAGKQAKVELDRRDVALVGIAAGPCTIAYNLRGLALFTDLFRHPDVAAQLFAYAGKVSAISTRIYAQVIGCDVIAVNDTPATMLKPEYFRAYVVPNLQEAWHTIHQMGKTSSFWA
jgi:uroporphyrinogen-III decarboxylase